jgi:hypothetical protein
LESIKQVIFILGNREQGTGNTPKDWEGLGRIGEQTETIKSSPLPLQGYPLPGSFLTFVRAIARKPPNLNPPLMILNKIRVLSRIIRYILSRVGKFSSVETIAT